MIATVTNTSDDLTLIQRFIDGRASLESSPNLRIESDLDTTRLFTKKGVFLAAVKLALNMRSVRWNPKTGQVNKL
ncbi:hypothetical protein [Phormidesmis priestleyi]|uniref:hypothetical protein n=1 Tax=Phormidesmis priestleyi TaxID=268141 RepID=UPI00083B290A|nr:hypothetical protein [Phormidesmis priestleyi]